MKKRLTSIFIGLALSTLIGASLYRTFNEPPHIHNEVCADLHESPVSKDVLEAEVPIMLNQAQILQQASAIPLDEPQGYFPQRVLKLLLPKVLIHDVERQNNYKATDSLADYPSLASTEITLESRYAASIAAVTPGLDAEDVHITIQGSQVIARYEAEGIEYMEATFFDGEIYKEASVYVGETKYTLRNNNNERIAMTDNEILREVDKGITQRDVNEFTKDYMKGLVDKSVGTYDPEYIIDYLATKRSKSMFHFSKILQWIKPNIFCPYRKVPLEELLQR